MKLLLLEHRFPKILGSFTHNGQYRTFNVYHLE